MRCVMPQPPHLMHGSLSCPSLPIVSRSISARLAVRFAVEHMREYCTGVCGRPKAACICDAFPPDKLPSPCRLLVLQHPKERERANRTDFIISGCLDRVEIETAKALRGQRCPRNALVDVYDRPDACALLYPAEGATVLSAECAPPTDVETLVALDATWQFATEMLRASPALQRLRCIALDCRDVRPAFTVRKANEGTLSTAEAVALCADLLSHDGPQLPRLTAVQRACRAYSALALQRATERGALRHRPDRTGYNPQLYSDQS